MGPVLTGLRTNWQNLGEDSQHGRWGVKLQGGIGEATGHSGRVVTVTNRAGKVSHVELGVQVDQWNAGRSAVYAVKRQGQRAKALQPTGEPTTLQLTNAEARLVRNAIGVDIGETDGTVAHYDLLNKINAHLGMPPVELPEYLR